MNKYNFGFVGKLPVRYAGLTIELVGELYDAVVKYGHDVSGVAVRRLVISLPDGRAMHLSAVVPREATHKRNLVVCSKSGMLQAQGATVIIIDDRNSFLVIESGFSPLDIQIAVEVIDEKMTRVGAYDPQTGNRSKVFHDFIDTPCTLRVKEAFGRPTTIISLVLTDQDDDAVRRMFDEPDEVAVISNDGQTAEVTTRQGFAIIRNATIETMNTFGISDPEELDGFSKERLAAFQAELAATIERHLMPLD